MDAGNLTSMTQERRKEARPSPQQTVDRGLNSPPQRPEPAAEAAPTPPVVPLRIRVQEGPDQQSSHALYEISLTLPTGYAWTVLRRYSEFGALHDELSTHLTEEERTLFPPKHWFASSKDPAVVQVGRDLSGICQSAAGAGRPSLCRNAVPP
jgi:hypothetical protein